jgi:hypothetical protein
MGKVTPIKERCPSCGKSLFETYRSGKRITMIQKAVGAKAPPEEALRTVVCLKQGCGYSREETVVLLTEPKL